jgi:pyruvate,orthophosphate dikinase
LNSSLPQVKVVRAAAAEVFAAAGASVEYQVGTMIEVPRGALRAGDLANHAEFFSFGTNDLTQVRGAGWLAGLMRLGVGG